MTSRAEIRRAAGEDAAVAAQLLHEFNTEFDSPTPGTEALTRRLEDLIERDDFAVFLGGEGPDGVAVLRLRPALWSRTLDAYVEELYVRPAARRRGIGRALMEATMAAARDAGAGRIDLGTEEDDAEARALYESLGFTNREGGPDGQLMMFYERDL